MGSEGKMLQLTPGIDERDILKFLKGKQKMEMSQASKKGLWKKQMVGMKVKITFQRKIYYTLVDLRQ